MNGAMVWLVNSVAVPMATLDSHEWITIASCAGHLGLATIALRRIAKSPVALPLALLCLDLFVFNAADVAFHVTADVVWARLDQSFAALLAPLTIRFALAFVGKSRSLRRLAWGFDVYFGAMAALTAGGFLNTPERWVEAVAPGAVAAVLALAWLFVAHLRSPIGAAERTRTWLVLAGLGLGTAGSVCDLLANVGLAIPRLGPFSLMLTTLVLSLVALRLGLFEGRLSWLTAANGIVLGGLQLFGYVAVFHFFGGNTALLVIGLGVLTLGLVPSALAMLRASANARERLEYHATLGRFSAQMAHDLRNPLAAIKGAAQYLEVEVKRGKPVDPSYLTLILEQTDRLNRSISEYQRIGRIQPVLAPIEVDALVGRVLGGQTLAAPANITLDRRLAANGTKCQADADLVSAALENVVRNAFEAMPGGGSVTVVTAHDPGFVTLSVVDTGKGMDPRHVEQAFADFFTTKATGSGLGLAFVKRVAEAHGGEASLTSVEGKGTTVTIRLPTMLAPQ